MVRKAVDKVKKIPRRLKQLKDGLKLIKTTKKEKQRTIVKPEIIDYVTRNYVSDYRFLKEAEIERNTILGKFKIDSTAYVDELSKKERGIDRNIGHFTLIESGFCVNQLLFTMGLHYLQKGIIKHREIRNAKNLKELLHKSLAGGFIIDYKVNFSRMIDPTKGFYGKVVVNRAFPRGKPTKEGEYKYWFFDADFAFGEELDKNGEVIPKSKGRVGFVLVLK